MIRQVLKPRIVTELLDEKRLGLNIFWICYWVREDPSESGRVRGFHGEGGGIGPVNKFNLVNSDWTAECQGEA